MGNVLFMIDLAETKKPDRNVPYQYSINSWKHYCKRHDIQFVILKDRIWGESYMNANWHKLAVFELLNNSGIDYDKVMIVDADTIVHPEAPNIFDLVGDKFYAAHNQGSYDWLLRSMENYSKFMFDDFWFPFYEYFNSGVMVVNRSHAKFFDEVLDFYHDNDERIRGMQDKFHVGTDQPVLNFMVQKKGIEFELLPFEWNMQDLARLEVLDLNLTFTNYGWVYHFNAIPSTYKPYPDQLTTPVYQWMQYVYNKLYE